MRRLIGGVLISLALGQALLLLCSCGGGTSQSSPEVVTAQETAPFRDTILPYSGAVTWTTAQAAQAGLANEPAGGRNAAQTSMIAAASRLATVDYAALSLPAFITQTRALKLKSSDFQAASPTEEWHARAQDEEKEWLLYSWRGPAFPDHPDRPKVHRWVVVYALYSLEEQKVSRVLTTIQGEVDE